MNIPVPLETDLGKITATGDIDVQGGTKIVTGGEAYYKGQVAMVAGGGITGFGNLSSDPRASTASGAAVSAHGRIRTNATKSPATTSRAAVSSSGMTGSSTAA